MTLAEKSSKKKKGSTPGRPKKKGNEYWDIGKVGRKTGITLEDKGIRDEHGLAPLENIFSSPVKKTDGTNTSSDLPMLESSGLEVDKTLNLRKTPRLPPPRASTPKHTNIGSPKRMSTGRPNSERVSANHQQDDSPSRSRTQPPANRKLDFCADGVRKSIESPSPFKPRHVLRRSTAQQEHPFASPAKPVSGVVEIVTDLEEEDYAAAASRQLLEDDGFQEDDGPVLLDDDDYYGAIPDRQSEDVEDAQAGAVEGSPIPSRTARSRKSDASINNNQIQQSPLVTSMNSSKKRTRSSLGEDHPEVDRSMSQSQISDSGPMSKKQRGKQPKKDKVIVHHRNGEDEAIDPALLAQGDMYEPNSTLEAALEPTNEPAKKGKGKKGKVPKERDPNLAMRAPGSPVKLNDSPSKLRNSRPSSRQSSAGPMNAYTLRATTPFEDAGERTSRFGRNLIQPLKYWANEARIYRRGEIEGIVRAEEVSKPKANKPKKKRKRIGKLDDIEEESESESVMADEWEDEMGVIAGMVANWDPRTQQGDPEDLIKEDIAFASTSIITRDVAGSDFKYAKVMTLPFFGSGVVELPPNGFKRAKNSRKMQMCFFVHEGKVMVEVFGKLDDGKGEREVTQFAISRGGVWVVPRGNNYSITNESKTTTARIFFAQGCEVDGLAGLSQEGAA